MQHRLKFTHTSGAGTLTSTITETADSEQNADLTIPNSANQEVDVAFDPDNLQMFYLQTDQDVTVRTNANGGGADDVFSVSSTNPLVWWASSGLASIFTAPVTKLYVQNASGQSAAVKCRALVDSTP